MIPDGNLNLCKRINNSRNEKKMGKYISSHFLINCFKQHEKSTLCWDNNIYEVKSIVIAQMMEGGMAYAIVSCFQVYKEDRL